MAQDPQAYYKELLAGFIRNTISVDQLRELFQYIDQEPQVYEQLMNDPGMLELIQQNTDELTVELPPAADQRIWGYLQTYAEGQVTGKVAALRSRRRWKWVAAAAVLAVGLITAVVISNSRHSSEAPVNPVALVDIKAPQTNRATITLANGRQVALDSLQKGVLAQQGDVKVVKLADGRIAYQPAAGAGVAAVQYNSLYNPRGSKVIDMALSDGSHVWLNAGSSLSFPVVFSGKERRVSVTGEAYFEIAPDAARPFYVSKGGLSVRVLGTHFNVNTYEDESEAKVTLLEGSVKVSKTDSGVAGDDHAVAVILRPGQQAAVAATDKQIGLVSSPDLEAVMAWKNGIFNFNKVSLQEVMRQLARWYDVEIVYEEGVTTKMLGGEMQRDLTLSEVLDGLKDIGVHCRIEGKKVIVLR